jgi:hypothetical protein
MIMYILYAQAFWVRRSVLGKNICLLAQQQASDSDIRDFLSQAERISGPKSAYLRTKIISKANDVDAHGQRGSLSTV